LLELPECGIESIKMGKGTPEPEGQWVARAACNILASPPPTGRKPHPDLRMPRETEVCWSVPARLSSDRTQAIGSWVRELMSSLGKSL